MKFSHRAFLALAISMLGQTAAHAVVRMVTISGTFSTTPYGSLPAESGAWSATALGDLAEVRIDADYYDKFRFTAFYGWAVRFDGYSTFGADAWLEFLNFDDPDTPGALEVQPYFSLTTLPAIDAEITKEGRALCDRLTEFGCGYYGPGKLTTDLGLAGVTHGVAGPFGTKNVDTTVDTINPGISTRSDYYVDPIEIGGGDGYRYIDYSVLYRATNLTITAVPEPATWSMMIGGIGVVGGAMRRRRVSTKVSFA